MSKLKGQRSKLIVELSVATIIALIPSNAKAQSLNCIEELIYGEIMTCGSPGTVTVRTDGSSTTSCVALGGAPVSRARCIATQSFPFRPMQISITASAFTISSGGNTMSVDSFNIITNAGGRTATVTAPFVNIPIGATLNVGGSQATGTYSGSFGISVVLQ